MKELILKKGKLNKNSFEEITSFLKKEKIAVLPTDTIYGLSARADSLEARNRILKMKERENKPFILLASSIEMILKYSYLNKRQQEYINEKNNKNKRPTTYILNLKKDNPLSFLSKDGSIALRLPKRPFLIKIIEELNIPLISTSLNISGSEVVNDLKLIKNNYFRNEKPDIILNEGMCKNKKPSKIIDLRDVNNILIIRK